MVGGDQAKVGVLVKDESLELRKIVFRALIFVIYEDVRLFGNETYEKEHLRSVERYCVQYATFTDYR